MDPKEDTKNGPEQNQPDAGPDAMQQESPRKCKICGGPNHHGCGCEAKVEKELAALEKAETFEASKRASSPEPKPAETYAVGPDNQRPTDAEIADTIERSEKIFGHIEAMSDNVSDFCGNVLTIISYLANIEQHLKEIHAMLKARIRSDAKQNGN